MMFGKKTEIASGNKIASDISLKNALVNFEVDFSGLKDTVALFFPSMQHEMVLRYRAETIAKIGIEAYRIVRDENIKINPIPPKIALPLIEKMSLEREPDMYEKWAKLLIAAGVNANPIHQQYADILANLNKHNANFLREIYTLQSKPNMAKEQTEKMYDEYCDKSRFQKYYNDINSNIKMQNIGMNEKSALLPKTGLFQIPFNFPRVISGSEKSNISENQVLVFNELGNAIVGADSYLVFTRDDKNMLLGLEKLDLIKCQFLFPDQSRDENGKALFVENCGVLLTKFGYSFVDCLEYPTK